MCYSKYQSLPRLVKKKKRIKTKTRERKKCAVSSVTKKKKKIRKRKTDKTEALVQVLEREDKAISKARGHAREGEKKRRERVEGKRRNNIADSRETEE